MVKNSHLFKFLEIFQEHLWFFKNLFCYMKIIVPKNTLKILPNYIILNFKLIEYVL